MIFKIVVLIILFAIIVALGSGLFFLMRDRDKGGSKRMAKALTYRICISFLLIALLLIGFFLGWITPHGISG